MSMSPEDKEKFITNSITSLKSVLEKYEKYSEEFIRFLMNECSGEFDNIQLVHGDEVIDQFNVITAMNVYYSRKFDEYKKEINNGNNEEKTEMIKFPENVVSFSDLKNKVKREEMN